MCLMESPLRLGWLILPGLPGLLNWFWYWCESGIEIRFLGEAPFHQWSGGCPCGGLMGQSGSSCCLSGSGGFHQRWPHPSCRVNFVGRLNLSKAHQSGIAKPRFQSIAGNEQCSWVPVMFSVFIKNCWTQAVIPELVHFSYIFKWFIIVLIIFLRMVGSSAKIPFIIPDVNFFTFFFSLTNLPAASSFISPFKEPIFVFLDPFLYVYFWVIIFGFYPYYILPSPFHGFIFLLFFKLLEIDS